MKRFVIIIYTRMHISYDSRVNFCCNFILYILNIVAAQLLPSYEPKCNTWKVLHQIFYMANIIVFICREKKPMRLCS